MAVIKVDGKSVTLDDEIANLGPEAIRAALAVDFPGIENADIKIDEPKHSGAPSVVTVSKRAAPKSASGINHAGAHALVLEQLAGAADFVNPAILMAAACMRADSQDDVDFLDRMMRRGEVERAVAAGEREGRAVHRALAALGRSKPESSKTVPVGF